MSRLARDTPLHAGALVVVCLMLAVIAASAWLRLARSHEACGLWPLCRIEHARTLDAIESTEAPQAPAVRAVHRVAASLALPVIAVMLVFALRRRPRERRATRGVALLLAFALGLAVLGAVAGGSRAIAVVLANLLGGYAMLAAAWCLLPAASAATDTDLRPAARRALAAWVLQIVLGALSGLLAPSYTAVVHLAWAFVVAGATAGVAKRARRGGLRGVGTALLAVVSAQWILGVGAALLGAPPALIVLHGLVAATGLALLAGLVCSPSHSSGPRSAH